jgi:HlyD family secretion protein
MLLVAALLALLVQDKSFDSGLRALAQDKPAAPGAEEETHAVKKGSLTPVFELEATFEAAEAFELRLRFESGAVEASLLKVAPHGAAVKKGDILLALDRGPLEKQAAAAENELRGARAALVKARADRELGAKADALALAQAEHALKDAEADLKDFDEVEGQHLLLNAELNVKQTDDMIADQKEELDQLEKMYKSEELTNATAEIVVRRARRSLERSKTYARIARESYDSIVKVKHPQQRRRHADAVDNARSALAQLKAAQALSATQRDVELAKAEAAVRQQEEQLGKLKKDLDALSVAAPFDGRVFWGQFQNGQWPPAEQSGQALHVGDKPPAGAVLLTLCGEALRAHADVPEAQYFGVQVGASAQVSPTASPERVSKGKVGGKSISALPRATGAAFDARIDFDAPPSELFHGMKAKATVLGRELKDVVLVPVAAVKKEGDKGTVKVMKDGKAAEREVKTGFSDGKMIHVRDGLSEGEAVAVPKG